jgi:type I restriction enzyme, S subunit
VTLDFIDQIPESWTLTTIANILLSLESGTRPKGGVKAVTEGIPSVGGEHLLYTGGFDFTNIRYVPTKFYHEMNRGKILKNDILVVKDGATTGKTAFVSKSFPFDNAAVNEHVFILRVFEKFIEPKYLFFWMQSPFGQKCIENNFQGTAQGGINSNFIQNSSIPIPPFPEQGRIVRKVEELFSFLDAGTESLRKVQEQLKRYRQAVLKYAFEGKLTENWRGAHKVFPDSFKTFPEDPEYVEFSSLPIRPNGWKWLKIKNVGKITGGLAKNSHRGKCSHNLPYLRVANVYAGFLSLDEIKYIGVNEEEIDKLLLKKGDLLIVEGNGSIDQIGRVATWDGQISPCIHQNHIIKIRFSDVEDSTFVLYWLLSPNGREYIRKVASSTSGLHTLSLSKVSELPIPFPSKIERHIIVEEIEQRLSILEHLEKSLPNLFLLTHKLQQSILKQAFEGRLISQIPTDEHAEKLLERIKVEKTKLTRVFENAKCEKSDQAELSHYV